MNEIPTYSSELIELLDKHTPEMCYDINLTKEENIYYAGQRSIVNGLLLIIEQNKNKKNNGE